MKKIGEYTARGIVSESETIAGEPAKITLFDGRFDTAYRVKEFYIWGSDWGTSSGPDVIGKLVTKDNEPTSAGGFMRSDNQNQIGWAGSSGGTDSTSQIVKGIVDPDNLIIEDLYVYARGANSSTSDPINYMIILEKYAITDWQGALAMARDAADEQ